jgi:hypothetical protein
LVDPLVTTELVGLYAGAKLPGVLAPKTKSSNAAYPFPSVSLVIERLPCPAADAHELKLVPEELELLLYGVKSWVVRSPPDP